MIRKRLTAFLMVFTFLFTMIPFDMNIVAMANGSEALYQNGKIILADFGYEGKANLRKKDDAFAYTTEFADEGKDTSMKFTLSSSNKELDIIPKIQRAEWPAGADLKVRMYNSASYNNSIVFALCSLETGFSPYKWTKITLAPGWNEASFSRTTIDSLLNNSSVGLEDSSNDVFLRINCSGWNVTDYTPGDVIYIDSMYLKLPGYSQIVASPEPSVENTAAFVEPDLGNNNIYTLTFAEEIWSDIHVEGNREYSIEDTIKVYEYDSNTMEYNLTEQSYSVYAQGNELNVAFDSELDIAAYKIVVDSDAFICTSGKKLSTDAEYYFSVGMESAIFTVVSTTPENGKLITELTKGQEYIINFNNELDPFDLELMVNITENGELFDDYSLSYGEKYIKLTSTEDFKPNAEYVITLSDEIADVNGFFLQGTKEFIFTTADSVGSDGVIFDASNPEHMKFIFESGVNKPSSAFKIETETENTLSGNAAFRINHDVLPLKTQWDAYISQKAIKNIKDYQYINYNIYSSQATDEVINLLLRTKEAVELGGANKDRFRYVLKTNWEGWKTVSVPVSSLKTENNMGNYVDATIINIGGWDSPRANAGYFLIDKIWVSNSVPEGVVLESAEFESGSCYLDENLGGDNAVSFEFSGNLFDNGFANAVKVEKYSDGGYEEFSDYEVAANGNVLDVCFNSSLASGTTLKISIDGAKVISDSYAIGSGYSEFEITIDGPSPYFVLKSSTPENGATVNKLDYAELIFNNELDKSFYIPDVISLYRDGEKMYNAFEATTQANKLILNFTKDLKVGSEYAIVISSDYTDAFGNGYTGDAIISFNYGEEVSESASHVIFSAGDVTENDGVKSFTTLPSSFVMNDTDTNLYPQNAKFAYKKSSAQSAQVNGYFVKEEVVPLEGMKYFNMLVFSPEKTANTAQIIFYTDSKNNKYEDDKRYKLPLNWQGWKLISIPLSDLMTIGKTIDGILLNTGGWRMEVPTAGYLLFDAVWVSKDKPTEISLESTSFANGYADAEISGEILTLRFNAELDKVSLPDITLIDEYGVETDAYEVAVSENEITITFGSLESSTTYNLTVDNVISSEFSRNSKPVVLSFTTKGEGVFLKKLELEDNTAISQIENISENAEEVTFVAYAIGEDNVLLEKAVKTVTATGNKTTEISHTFDVSDGIVDVKIFVLDSKGRFVSKKYFDGKTDSVVYLSQISGSNASVGIESYSLNVNVFDVQMILSAVSNAAVVEIINQNSEVLAANVVRADEAGKAEFYYVFASDIASGNYDVKITCDGKSIVQTFTYLSDEDRTKFSELVNGNSISTLAGFIKTKKDVFNMNDYSDAQIEDFAEIVINNGPYDNYAQALKVTQNIPVILDEFNQASWAELSLLIEEYSELLGGNSNSDVKYFLGLSDKNQNAISQILKDELPVDTYEELIKEFGNAVDEFKDSKDEGGSTGGSSSGSGSSRGSSMGGSFPVVPDANPYTPIETETVFKDLSDASWATDYVMTLYKNGVVSSPSDGKFRPNDNITREEFVKMLVVAFGENTAYVPHRFSDEAAGAWYNEYLSKAYALGITKGYPDGSFGIGENISREDMVTMCARTLEILGQNMTSQGQLSFADANSISDYAYSYVNTLSQIGVVNGMEDGTFAPKSTATRAQAAKVVSMLMELY